MTGAKQTVSLTINSDLYAEATKLGIDVSQVAEEALTQLVARRKAEQLRAEIQADIETTDAYMAKYGSFADMVRQHYRRDGDD